MSIQWSTMKRGLTVGFLAIATSTSNIGHAQTTAAKNDAKQLVDPTGGLPVAATTEREEVRVIKLRPRAAEAVSKSRLYPCRSDIKPGNAAPIFLRQNFEASSAMEKRKTFFRESREQGERRLNDPKLLEAESLGLYRFGELERAAYREQAGWEYPLYEPQYEGGGIRTLLPDVQESRICAMYLSELSRSYIAQGEVAKAERTIRTGLALTRHLSETPFMVVKLVGAAQCGYYQSVLEELIQSPQSPNYYWDLAGLPRPLIDVRSAIQWEWNILPQTYPELQNLDVVVTAEQWQLLYERVIGGILEMDDGRVPKAGTPELEQLKKDWVKKSRELLPRLDASHADRVAAMSDAEVSIRYWWFRVQQLQNMLFAPALLEPHLAIEQLVIQEKQVAEMFQGEEFILNSIMPFVASNQIRALAAREQRFAMLRTVEAIRHWSAGHDGKLPGSLSELTLPAPLDPLSSQAFVYQRASDGQSAELRGKFIKLDKDTVKYGYTYRLEL